LLYSQGFVLCFEELLDSVQLLIIFDDLWNLAALPIKFKASAQNSWRVWLVVFMINEKSLPLNTDLKKSQGVLRRSFLSRAFGGGLGTHLSLLSISFVNTPVV